MYLNSNIRKLRKHYGYGQEEMAGMLFTTRSAVASWESGRCCPSLETIMAIKEKFLITDIAAFIQDKSWAPTTPIKSNKSVS